MLISENSPLPFSLDCLLRKIDEWIPLRVGKIGDGMESWLLCHTMVWDGTEPLGPIPQWDGMGFYWYHTMVWYMYGISYCWPWDRSRWPWMLAMDR